MIKSTRAKTIKLLFILFPIIIFTGLRSENIGVDTIAYLDEYISAQHGSPYYRPTEPLFSLLVAICTSIGLSFNGFLLIQSALYYLSLAHLAITTQSKNNFIYVALIISLGLFSFGLSGVRQSIAMAIFFFSVYFLVRGRIFIYSLLSLIAFLFHNSSIVPFSLLFLVRKLKLSLGSYFILIAATPIFYFITDNSIISYVKFINIKQIQGFDVDSEDLLNPKLPLSIYFFSLLIFFLISRKRNNDNEYNENQSIHIMLWGTVFAASFFWLATSVRLVDRIGFYFVPLLAALSTLPFKRIGGSVGTTALLSAVIFVLMLSTAYSIIRALNY